MAKLLVTLLALTAGLAGSLGDYRSMDAQGEPFRSEFNAASGKVRVVMLVAPT